MSTARAHSFCPPAVKAMSYPSTKVITKTSTYKDVARKCAEDSYISDSIYGPIH